jgi:hypothetical protein
MNFPPLFLGNFKVMNTVKGSRKFVFAISSVLSHRSSCSFDPFKKFNPDGIVNDSSQSTSTTRLLTKKEEEEGSCIANRGNPRAHSTLLYIKRRPREGGRQAITDISKLMKSSFHLMPQTTKRGE